MLNLLRLAVLVLGLIHYPSVSVAQVHGFFIGEDQGDVATPPTDKQHEPFDGELSLGFQNATVWIRLDIEKAANDLGKPLNETTIRVSPYQLAEVVFYQKIQGNWEKSTAGASVSKREDTPCLDAEHCFRVHPQVDGPVYLRIRTPTILSLSVEISDLTNTRFDSASRISRTSMAITIASGLMVLALLFALADKSALAWAYLFLQANVFLTLVGTNGELAAWFPLISPSIWYDITLIAIVCRTAAMALLIHAILRSHEPNRWFFYATWGVLSVQAVNTVLILTGFAFVALPINLLIFSTLPVIALLGVLSTRDMPRSTKRILTGSALIFGMVVLFGVINSTNIFHGNESTTLFEGVADRKLSGLGFGLFVLAFLVSENTRKKFIAYQEKQKLQLMIVNSQQQTQAIKDRGMLIDMLTHEIKNPLGTIRFAANGLWDAVDKEPSQKERFQRLMTSVNRINDLLEQVALSNKVERSDLVLEKEPIGIRDFVEDLVDDLNEPSRFKISITPDLSHHINRAMLTIAFENLLINATKYSPSGTPILIEAVSLVTSSNNTHGKLDGAGSGIRIRVENQLPLDAHPDLSLLFKPYYRHPVSGQQPGMGLGLSLVKTAIEKLGGVIDVNIQNGRIFFEVSLP